MLWEEFRGARMSSFLLRGGTGSLLPETVALEANKSLKMLLFNWASLTVSFPSIKGGIVEHFWLFINLDKIENFFLAEIEKLCMVEFTEL